MGEFLKRMRGNWMRSGFGYKLWPCAVLLVPKFLGAASVRDGRSFQVSIHFSMLRVSLI